MSIKDRIRRLEETDGPEPCLECRLRPKATRAVYPGEEHRDPEPQHCPGCGRLIEVFVIRVVYEGEG